MTRPALFASHTRVVYTATALAAISLLGACSSLQTDKVDYRTTVKAPELAVPPDLTQLSKTTRYTVVDGGVSASSLQRSDITTGTIAPDKVGNVRLERDGSARWLVVDRAPEKVWDTVKAFWLENGLPIATAQQDTGVMETDWGENKAKLPMDGIRKALGGILDSVYDTGERDKYRTRIERNEKGGTNIYITHRGMQEVYVREGTKETMWQPRAADPGLEAEFLARLMVKLGSSTEQAQQQVAQSATPAPSKATVVTQDGLPVVVLNEDFDRAWRRVALTLDRTGFTVEDRDRKQGLFYVRYAVATSENSDPGFFARMFKGAKAIEPGKYRLALQTQGNQTTTIKVLNEAGQPDTTPAAESIAKVLAEDIK
ncbi:outer membrane protein assembly factor BamC [Curvibacter sp. CHRR-16]|uniref:outer membrane protein assembly factor BamC n=1 Tax=Curvibacter sp. CHRR-16 TaxID=2835872 RepID=UPI001BD9BBB1|nr:outer membrane protein assembly factor BamC [Curvibacter sp. CHRR-16]MBT0568811.1 outer membrane protein assembly factor BamC [Curvibacter sp. CHRR-16]